MFCLSGLLRYGVYMCICYFVGTYVEVCLFVGWLVGFNWWFSFLVVVCFCLLVIST